MRPGQAVVALNEIATGLTDATDIVVLHLVIRLLRCSICRLGSRNCFSCSLVDRLVGQFVHLFVIQQVYDRGHQIVVVRLQSHDSLLSRDVRLVDGQLNVLFRRLFVRTRIVVLDDLCMSLRQRVLNVWIKTKFWVKLKSL